MESRTKIPINIHRVENELIIDNLIQAEDNNNNNNNNGRQNYNDTTIVETITNLVTQVHQLRQVQTETTTRLDNTLIELNNLLVINFRLLIKILIN